jgi:hypothetical protein
VNKLELFLSAPEFTRNISEFIRDNCRRFSRNEEEEGMNYKIE